MLASEVMYLALVPELILLALELIFMAIAPELIVLTPELICNGISSRSAPELKLLASELMYPVSGDEHYSEIQS